MNSLVSLYRKVLGPDMDQKVEKSLGKSENNAWSGPFLGYGSAYSPHPCLVRKYKNTDKEWQYVFPSGNLTHSNRKGAEI